MAPNYPGQHSHFFLIIWANSSEPECAGLRATTEKGLLVKRSSRFLLHVLENLRLVEVKMLTTKPDKWY
jgi:hypothetical protein